MTIHGLLLLFRTKVKLQACCSLYGIFVHFTYLITYLITPLFSSFAFEKATCSYALCATNSYDAIVWNVSASRIFCQGERKVETNIRKRSFVFSFYSEISSSNDFYFKITWKYTFRREVFRGELTLIRTVGDYFIIVGHRREGRWERGIL